MEDVICLRTRVKPLADVPYQVSERAVLRADGFLEFFPVSCKGENLHTPGETLFFSEDKGSDKQASDKPGRPCHQYGAVFQTAGLGNGAGGSPDDFFQCDAAHRSRA